MATKWLVQTDEDGNLYFCNCITGESVWELPEEEENDEAFEVNEDDTIQDEQVEVFKPKEQYSVYAVAVGVVEVVVKLVEQIEVNAERAKKLNTRRKFMSPAAEKRFFKNAANDDKRKKRFHDRTVNAYLNLLVRRIDAEGTSTEQESKKCREVGSLFSAEESRKWQNDREQERDAKRRAIRRARKQHHAQVESLKRRQHMLILFRSDLTKYLLGRIMCSTELQKQRILLLTTPQMQAEILERKREMQRKIEPELAEKLAVEEKQAKQKYEKNIRKVFQIIDESGTGKLHLLQILFGVFSKERPQKYAGRVQGLAELLRSTDLQRFLIEFVSQFSEQNPVDVRMISANEFHEFVTIIEEVLEHYAGVKAAVDDAENDIEATLAAASTASGTSLARARIGIMSAKKVKHELAMLKEHEAQLQALRDREKRRGFGLEPNSLVAVKEKWEKNHHHRLIRLKKNLPLFCCLCRRRKWELWRREHEECESEYRSHWPAFYALRLKDEELQFIQKRDKENVISSETTERVHHLEEVTHAKEERSTESQRTKYEPQALQGRVDRVSIAVRQTVMTLVMLVEATMSEPSLNQRSPQRRVHKKKAIVSPSKRVKGPPTTEVMERMKVFENEEQERKTMYTEELRMAIMLERNRRSIERPLLRIQDSSHDAYIRLIEHCARPSGFLLRLDFERCLAFDPPQRMVIAVTDNGVKSKLLGVPNRLVLQTVPCRTEEMAKYVFSHAKIIQKSLRNPFVAELSSVDKHLFQLFSEPGLLVECWPVVFVASEYFHKGSWLEYYRRHFIEERMAYAGVEQHLRGVFREVASGLAAMHSLGLQHLNVNMGNIYIASDTGPQHNSIHVKISGLLSWKRDFDEDDLNRSEMHDCFNSKYAPPEVIKELPITTKADAWMLGCTLCEALFMWQRQQLISSTPNQPAQPTSPLAFHTKSVNDLLQRVPIATSAAMRSILRMLLQPNPAQRPLMNQVVDLLSFPNSNASGEK